MLKKKCHTNSLLKLHSYDHCKIEYVWNSNTKYTIILWSKWQVIRRIRLHCYHMLKQDHTIIILYYDIFSTTYYIIHHILYIYILYIYINISMFILCSYIIFVDHRRPPVSPHQGQRVPCAAALRDPSDRSMISGCQYRCWCCGNHGKIMEKSWQLWWLI